MSHLDARAHLEIALDAVLAAGPIALEYFRKPIAIDDKRKDGRYDPVTEADRGIEAFLRERLREVFPGHGIVGEEHGSEGQGETYWVIDPIDGTRAFISGMPTWGILLGLVHEGRPVAGIMHQPFTGETWYAAAGTGARFRLRDHESVLCTRADATLASAVLYSTHPSMFSDAAMLARYDDLAAQCRLQRWGGDCYALALVAQGGIDLMVDANLAPYDILPLVPIIEEAGGVVTDLEGRTPLAGGTVVAAANPALHAAALAIMCGRSS
jgi:myo-inositol-1(or 4)-monophosphatase